MVNKSATTLRTAVCRVSPQILETLFFSIMSRTVGSGKQPTTYSKEKWIVLRSGWHFPFLFNGVAFFSNVILLYVQSPRGEILHVEIYNAWVFEFYDFTLDVIMIRNVIFLHLDLRWCSLIHASGKYDSAMQGKKTSLSFRHINVVEN